MAKDKAQNIKKASQKEAKAAKPKETVELEQEVESTEGVDEIQKDEATNEEVSSEETKPEENSDEKYVRLMADFQNYKRRTEKEKSDIYAYANEKIAVQLLDVIDNFERALVQSEANGASEGFEEGMHMILKQLQDVLSKNGVEEIVSLGEDFDPNFHNAVMMEATDEYESGKVSAVLQKGYKLNGKVIRPSMVKVVS